MAAVMTVIMVMAIVTIVACGVSVLHIEVLIVLGSRRLVVLVVCESAWTTILGESLNVGARHGCFLVVVGVR